MAVQLGGSVRGEPYPVLLGEVGDAQGFGEAGGAGCIELHVTDAVLDNQIAYRERVSSRSPCASGIAVAAASRAKSAGCRY